MYVTVHRGTGQIGGNLIEIGTNKTRLLFDVGANLPPLDQPQTKDDFQLEGLTQGTPTFHGVFISHHHNDHCGLMGKVLPGIPIYAGRETTRILNVIADFTDQPRPEVHFHFTSGESIPAGDLTVTPLGVDHSAQDAYMFLIQADGKSILYTGDYRSADQIPGQVKTLLNGKSLDLLISEGTNIQPFGRGPRTTLRDERTLEEAAVSFMEEYDGTVFVLCSSTNEERIQSIRRAAERTGRMACQDLFQTVVRGQKASQNLQGFMAFGVNEKDTPRVWPYFQSLHQDLKLIGAETLAGFGNKQVIFVRTSMDRFITKYLNFRSDGKKNLLIYSMWTGYKTSGRTLKFLNFCKGKDLDIVDLHCSGHAYSQTIRQLIENLSPAALLPIHCEKEDRKRFQDLHPNCLMLKDGQRWEVSPRPLEDIEQDLWQRQRWADSSEERAHFKKLYLLYRFVLRQIRQDVPGSQYRWDGGSASSYDELLACLQNRSAEVSRYIPTETGLEELVRFRLEPQKGSLKETWFHLNETVAAADFEGADWTDFQTSLALYRQYS